jgi:hypothetical protein
MRDDAKRAADRALADLLKQSEDKKQAAETAYQAERTQLEAQLTKIRNAQQDAYGDQIGDALDFFKTYDNILKALQAGTLTIDQVRSQWFQGQGIPFNGNPWAPVAQPHSCPSGCHWSDEDQSCVTVGGNPCTSGTTALSVVSGTTNTNTSTTPTTTQNLRVTLNVTGDGILAAAVRQSAVNAVWDIIKD